MNSPLGVFDDPLRLGVECSRPRYPGLSLDVVSEEKRGQLNLDKKDQDGVDTLSGL